MVSHLCYWLNQKGVPCPWNSVSPDKNYCKRHSIYEGIFTPSDIKSLVKCSGCKNYWKPDPNSTNKTCTQCILRATTNRVKEKQEGLVDSSKKCLRCVEINKSNPTKPIESSDYCGKHQTWGKWKKLTDDGNKVCTGWTRGCFNVILDDFARCKDCRNKAQEKENILNKQKKNKAIEFNENLTGDNKNLMCVICNLIDIKEKFTNNKCAKCFENYKRAESNRKKN